jgi:hypothetical protein
MPGGGLCPLSSFKCDLIIGILQKKNIGSSSD